MPCSHPIKATGTSNLTRYTADYGVQVDLGNYWTGVVRRHHIGARQFPQRLAVNGRSSSYPGRGSR